MTSRLLFVLVSIAVYPLLAAGEHGGHGDPFLFKKIVNFAILAAGIIYLFVKVLGPALQSQQRQIADSLNQAHRRAEQAAEQAREIDARMAGLESEIAALREKARAEMQAEAERMQRDTTAQLAKIEQNAAQEIESAIKFARQEVKAYAAALAVDMARQRIAESLDEPAQDRLVRRFTAGLTATPAAQN